MDPIHSLKSLCALISEAAGHMNRTEFKLGLGSFVALVLVGALLAWRDRRQPK